MKSIWCGFISVAMIAAAAPAGGQQQGLGPGPQAPQIELPPRYRVEFIIFAHNRFDSAEEHFDTVPQQSRFAAGDEPIPLRYFDADDRLALRELVEVPIIPEPEPVPEELPAESEGEIAAADESQPDADTVLEAWLDPALVEGPATRYLDLDELTLLPVLDRLERLDAYTPLVHSGWEQNGLAEADAVPIDMSEFGISNPRGTIRLHMSRYLHISVDLAYRDIAVTFGGNTFGEVPVYTDTPLGQAQLPAGRGFGSVSSGGVPEYYLFEQRRILRGELNYFDHPAFGLLLKITLAPESDESPARADGPSA